MNDIIYKKNNIRSIQISPESNIDEIINQYREISNINKKDLLMIYDNDYDTILSTDELGNLFEFINKNILNTMDIFYLSNYMDNINKAEKIKIDKNDYKLNFYRTYSPNGLNCAISTIEGWDKVFNIIDSNKSKNINLTLFNAINSSKILAASSWPRVFYPKLDLSKDNKSFIFNDWKENDKFGRKIPSTHKYSFGWFFLTCLISLCIIYYIKMKIPVNRFFKINDKNKVVIV